MYMHGIVDSEDYKDYAKDYGHLGDIFTDIGHGFTSIVSNIWNAIKPVAPAILYQAATGRELPPAQDTQQNIVRPSTPITTYLMYGGAALIAGLLVMKMASSGRRR